MRWIVVVFICAALSSGCSMRGRKFVEKLKFSSNIIEMARAYKIEQRPLAPLVKVALMRAHIRMEYWLATGNVEAFNAYQQSLVELTEVLKLYESTSEHPEK